MKKTAQTAAQVAEAGRRGADVRSDCWVKVTLTGSGGIEVALKSKVDSLYGEATRQLVRDELGVLGLKNARVEIEDGGALPFVILARVETAVRRLGLDVGEGCIPDFAPGTEYPTERDRFRRSRLYIPGDEPKFMLNAGLHRPDGIILDLEDGVATSEKDAARLVVRNALRSVNFHGAERMVRVNQGERGLEDLEFVVPHNVHVVLIPKVEAPEQVKRVDQRTRELLSARKIDRPVYLMPIVESGLGVIRAYEIASATDRIVAFSIGLEDYTADIGAARTKEGRESFWARSQVVNAARAAGVQPMDAVFSDVADLEGLRDSVLEAKGLGFDGKCCIHPRQIAVIHEAFAPTEEELAEAKRIVEAFEDAERRGVGVVSLGSKMIDPPVVKRAQRIVRLANAMGMVR
ncbi:MAG: HpcH/HpaI aldolase/citrate lyase family protein [Phycisphaerales bacterium]|nr:MAG: HpcH/HpaI aldolase/citrate lyase family protein [Phycisphaerales bacterium]